MPRVSSSFRVPPSRDGVAGQPARHPWLSLMELLHAYAQGLTFSGTRAIVAPMR